MPNSILCKLAIAVGGNVGSKRDRNADVLAVTSATELRNCKDLCQNQLCVILQLLLAVTFAAMWTMMLMISLIVLAVR